MISSYLRVDDIIPKEMIIASILRYADIGIIPKVDDIILP